jgi:hypothetical protein
MITLLKKIWNKPDPKEHLKKKTINIITSDRKKSRLTETLYYLTKIEALPDSMLSRNNLSDTQ